MKIMELKTGLQGMWQPAVTVLALHESAAFLQDFPSHLRVGLMDWTRRVVRTEVKCLMLKTIIWFAVRRSARDRWWLRLKKAQGHLSD